MLAISSGPNPEAGGRLTGEVPGRGRIQLGGSGGASGVGQALEAVTDREAGTSRYPATSSNGT
jgi:hypothetical protein